MKIMKLALAATLAAGSMSVIAVPAAAQPDEHRGDRGYDHRGDSGYDHRGDDRNDRDHMRHNASWHDNGRHEGWRNHHRRDCRWVWRHHHREQLCSWNRWH
jgi:opacity protein-like surface antigen